MTYHNKIILFLLLLPCLLLSLTTAAQRAISGVVTDAAGTPLIGVNIVEVGTPNGTVTDLNGKFAMTVEEGARLTFSYIGFQGQTLEVGNQTLLNVMMSEGASLDEVVVIGYGTEKKINLTGSVATIKSDALTTVPTASTSGLLTGRLPGLITKQTSGLPGSDDTNIRIRGFAGAPLVLIDGVQTTDGLNRIDPNDIESISILKDASAAVYGSRAGNGVILVTTKRGRKGPPTLSYDGSITFQEATSFQEHVNAAEYVEIVREADLLDVGDPDATFSREDLANYRTGAPGFEGGNWVNALIDNYAPMQQHSLKASGGSDHVRYFTSVGYTGQESYFRSRDYDYNRFNARSNIDVNINENISFLIDLSYRVDNRNRPQSGTDNIWNELQTALPIYITELPNPSVGVPYSGFSQRNPVARSSRDIQGTYDRRDDTFRGKLGLTYRFPFIQGLQIRAEINTELTQRSIKSLVTPFQVFQYNAIDDEYIDQGANTPRSRVSDFQLRRQQVYPLLALEYNRSFGNHDIKFLALAEQISRKQSEVSAIREDLLTTAIPELFTGSQDLQFANGGSLADIGRKSLVGRFNYAYKNKYLFEAAFRADGNVLFAPQTRWGYFPSFSAGWVISREPFMAGITNVVDNLKIRMSYSRLGDDSAEGLNGFDYLSGYTQEGIYLLGNNESQPRIHTLGLANPALTWEEITLYNFGLEATFLEGRLILEADFFYRNREGLLGANIQDIPSTFGANLPLVNLNSRTNRGFEAMLTYQQRIGDLRLTISPNITFARAKWGEVFDEEDYDDPDQKRINSRSGQWVNRNFGYLSDGIFMSQQEIDNHLVDQDEQGNSTLRPGDIRYIDLNGDGVLNFRDQTVIAYANGNPEFLYGMTFGATYKSVGLSMLFQGASRFSLNISGSARNMFSNFSTPLIYHRDLRWQPDEDNPTVNINPNAQLPAATTSPGANNGLNSDFYRKDVTYLRLKNVNLYFNVPNRISSKVGIESVQFYVAAENVFTWSNLGIYKNSFDPESTVSSAARNYPINRNFTGGLRVTF